MTILYCKNTPVLNIDTNEILKKALLPGYIREYGNNPNAFKAWLKLRYSSNTNTLARQLKGITFGQGNRVRINKETRALSLSECYWIKSDSDSTVFEQVSPYYAPFWTGLTNEEYESGKAVPTLYTPGYLSKQWINSKTLYKVGKETLIEKACTDLCEACEIPVEHIEICPNGMGILVSNITTPDLMLEQADQSGLIDPDDFDGNTIVSNFGLAGYQMFLIDAIVGNGDRHAGNFGWLRDSNTGAYLGLAPLYDFDHALDAKSTNDILIQEAIEISKQSQEFMCRGQQILNVTLSLNTHKIFKQRALVIKQQLSI